MTTTARLLTEMFAERLPGLRHRVHCADCGESFTTTIADPHPTCTRCLALDKDRGIETRGY